MLPGLALFAAGFVLIFAVLARQGALAKSRQLGALRDALAGRAGGGIRIAVLLGLVLLGLGTCGSLVGVGLGDRNACEAFCARRGYARATIRDSTERSAENPGRPAFRACACEGGPAPDPLEVVATRIPADGPAAPRAAPFPASPSSIGSSAPPR